MYLSDAGALLAKLAFVLQLRGVMVAGFIVAGWRCLYQRENFVSIEVISAFGSQSSQSDVLILYLRTTQRFFTPIEIRLLLFKSNR